MNLDSIDNYLSESKKNEFAQIADEAYFLTEHLKETYPDYENWFYQKQVAGCLDKIRNIFFVRNEKGEMVAISCVKKDEEEKKICTLFVNPEYRKHGLGSLLLESSIQFLETTTPLITFEEDKLDMFEGIIKKYNWELTEIVPDIYNKGAREFCFNGQLTDRDYKQELVQAFRNLKQAATEQLKPHEKLGRLAKK